MDRLPGELIDIILQHLPTSSESVRTLVALLTVNSYIASNAISNAAWEPQLHWKHSSSTLVRGNKSAYEWYAIRAKIDREFALDRIITLIEGTNHRIPAMQRLSSGGLDILDKLIALSEIAAEDDPKNYLATRYWASEAIETISRRHAMAIWAKMAQGGYEDLAKAFEEGALAFGLFRGQYPGQVRHSHLFALCAYVLTHP